MVSKYQGVCVHTEDNVIGLIEQLKNDFSCGTIYPVHRLDKVTSGLIICAKNHTAASELSQLFQNRQIEKYYLALSDQKPKKKQGLITGDMEKARRGSWKLCHSKDNPAITQFFSYSAGSGLRVFLLKPKTGKTHQLRVALKSIASPIIGDRLYGHQQNACKQADLVGGIYLHAYTLRFHYQNEEYSFVDIPKHWVSEYCDSSVKANGENNKESGMGLNSVLEQYARPWLLPWPKV